MALSLPGPAGPSTYPNIFFVLTFKPITLPHENTFFLKLENLIPFALIVSCIFSQIRGTPRKAVGFTSCRVLIRVPCKGPGWVSHTCTLPGTQMSLSPQPASSAPEKLG